MTTNHPKNNHGGYTLIEVLVVVAVIALLISLLVPAIQAARESARRSACLNNLKQIGLATASYIDSNNCYPNSIGTCSPLARLLPYLDNTTIYNSINFEGDASVVNSTLVGIEISVFLCPTDSGYRLKSGMTNYGVNGGTNSILNAPFSPLNDPSPIRTSQVTDGTSVTALASEWLLGLPFGQRDEQRTAFQTLNFTTSSDDFIINCRDLDYRTAGFGGVIKGDNWLNPGYGETLYNHQQEIGGHTCSNAGANPSGSWTVVSGHSGLVNVVFADMHVQSVKQTTSLSVWKALGTMNGNELVGEF